MKFYAIKEGRSSGKIVYSWGECKKLVHGYSNAKYKSFDTLEAAETYLNPVKRQKKEKTFYAIKKGRESNVIVRTWIQCKNLTIHFPGAKYKSFYTREEAESYLNE